MDSTFPSCVKLSKPMHRSVLRLYLADKMEWLNDEDSMWTCVLSPELRAALKRLLPTNVEVVYPDDTGFDHWADLGTSIVAADLALLKSYNACVAVFSTPSQVGTLMEAWKPFKTVWRYEAASSASDVKCSTFVNKAVSRRFRRKCRVKSRVKPLKNVLHLSIVAEGVDVYA